MSKQSRIEFGAFELTEKTKQNVLDCLESGWLTLGPRVKGLKKGGKNYLIIRMLDA